MNVRAQLFGQKWQRVVSSFIAVYSRSIAASMPMNVDVPLALDHAQGLHRGADRAGLAGVRVDVDLGARDALLDVVDLRLDRGEVVLRAALEHELACPSSAMRGICTTYCQTFFGSTCASPASSSSFEKPSFWKFTRSESRNTAQP